MVGVNITITVSQQIALNIIQRVAAICSMGCSVYLITSVLRSKYYRSRIYHRIMVGCAINIVLICCVDLWGSLAVPSSYGIHYMNDDVDSNNGGDSVVDSATNTSMDTYYDDYNDNPAQYDGETVTSTTNNNHHNQQQSTLHYVVGARGNITTCNIQGFLYVALSFQIPFYYISLSLLSLMAIRSKFQLVKYMWIEKYIHIAVHVLPIVSSSFLLLKDAINPAIRSCHFVSIPIGCGIHNGFDIQQNSSTNTGNESSPVSSNLKFPCQRGPQNIATLQNMFYVIPFLFIMLFPPVIMSIAYLQVRYFYYHHHSSSSKTTTPTIAATRTTNKNDNDDSRKNTTARHNNRGGNVVVAHSVAKQSAVYLLALYGIYAFDIIDSALVNRTQQYFFIMNLLATTTKSSIGVWTLLVYLYFRSEDPIQVQRRGSSHLGSGGGSSLAFTTSKRGGGSSSLFVAATTTQAMMPKSSSSNHLTSNVERQLNTNTRNSNDQEHGDGSSENYVGGGGDGPAHSQTSPSNEDITFRVGGGCIRRFQRPEFSIFDGSHLMQSADSPWAEFLYDDYEDAEYQQDCGEYDDTTYYMRDPQSDGKITAAEATVTADTGSAAASVVPQMQVQHNHQQTTAPVPSP